MLTSFCFLQMMGLFGSAFCASVREIQSSLGLPSFLNPFVKAMGQTRFVSMAANHNFMYGLKEDGVVSRSQKVLELVDAGVHVNCPLPTFFGRPERKVDLVIAFDARPTEEKDEKKAANDSKVCIGVLMHPYLSDSRNLCVMQDVLRAFLDYCKTHSKFHSVVCLVMLYSRRVVGLGAQVCTILPSI